MEKPLRSRFPQLLWIDAVQALHWLPPANPRVKGLAQVNWELVRTELQKRFGWRATQQDIKKIEIAADEQLTKLLYSVPLKTKRCTKEERKPLREGGW